MKWKQIFNKKSGIRDNSASLEVLRHGHAERIHFYYPGEDGTYVENPMVTLFANGIVHIRADSEETTTHLSHCEIIWKVKLDAQERTSPETPGTDRGHVLPFPRKPIV